MMKLISFTVLFVFIIFNTVINQALARVELEPQSLAKFKQYNAKTSPAEQKTIKRELTTKTSVSLIHQGYSDQNYEFSAKSLMVITNRDSYERELYKHSSDTAQTINFEQQKVLMVVSGNQPNSGSFLTITNVREFDDYVKIGVTLNIENPDDDCGYPAMIVNPYKIYTITSTKRIIFTEKIKRAKKC